MEGHELAADRVPLQGKFDDFKLPDWANGALVSSGPSFFSAGKKEFKHYLDGFGRFSRFDFKDGEVQFTTKMLESEWYKACKKADDVVGGLIFKETEPPRWKSNIPGYNLYMQGKYGDNNWVSLEKLPGDGPYYTTTDSPVRLMFDPVTLEPLGKLEYEDDTGICKFGVSHSKYLPDGSQISICGDMDVHSMKMMLIVFRIRPETPLQREVIARIPTAKMSYQHAFAMSENHVIVFESPYFMDLKMPLLGYDISQTIVNDPKGTTKIHAVGIEDGKVTSFESGIWTVVLHYGNTFEKDGKIIVDAPTYEDPNRDPFDLMLFENMQESDVMDQASGSKYKRFTLDLESGVAKNEDLLTIENGQIDLPIHHPSWDRKDYCYSYMLKLFQGEALDETFKFPVVKYDHCQGKEIASWGEGMFAAQEVQFVPNPNGTTEDDGLLLVVGYRMMNRETALHVIDAKTMETVQEYRTPFPLPMAFHASYWPGATF